MDDNRPTLQQAVVEDRTIRIIDQGKKLLLDYSGAKKSHQGDSWWGLAVGFRAMQLAADVLSKEQLWDRKNLLVTSAHPGPGVRDAIEFVTACVERRNYHLTDQCASQKGCSSQMKYEWQISDGLVTIEVTLREDFVPTEFYELCDRLRTTHQVTEDKSLFKQYKAELSEALWMEPLATAFNTRFKKP
jgi:hypothetical protein